MQDFDPHNYLEQVAQAQRDDDFDIALAAISLAANNYEGRVLERYVNHIKKLQDKVYERFVELLKAGAVDDVDTRIAALKYVIHEKFEYKGDTESYDSLQNANLIEVIERRKGLPVALGTLYISCAKANGWDIVGLNFPAHFILRMEYDSERRIIDPFNDVKILEAPDLRELVKTFLGPNAELSADYYEAVSQKDVLIRLQNNLKLRLIDMEDYQGALDIVKQMEKVAPQETRFFLDEGVLLAKLGHRQAAIERLEDYVGTDIPWQEKQEIEAFIAELKTSLN